MAVKFGANKSLSPRRQIFNIDTFLGVDLTNSGTSMDEVRSPNAENMVRLVPGKVRKRTGYKSKMVFASPVDVNRAKKTSDDWVKIVFDEDKIYYETYEDLLPAWLRAEFEAVGTYRIYVCLNTTPEMLWPSTTITGTSDTPYNSLWNFGEITGISGYEVWGIKVERISNDADDYIKIRRLTICGETVATTQEEWGELPWSPAPEDSGATLIKVDETDPIYGCHILKTGTVTGNRIVNVNRVLNTSDDWQTFNLTATNWKRAYTLGESFYKDEVNYPDGIDIYVTFDYMSDEDVQMRINGCTYTDYTNLIATNGEVVHKEFNVKCGKYGASQIIALRKVSNNATLKIKNMSIVYEKNEDYVWSAAPEDSNDTFHIEDIYNYSSRDYALRTTASGSAVAESSSNTKVDSQSIIGTSARGFCIVEFYITTNASSVDDIQICLVDSHDNEVAGSELFHSNLNGKHFSFIASGAKANYYVRRIRANFWTTAGVTCSMSVSNIKVHKITPKTNYGISKATYLYHVGGRYYSRRDNSDECTLLYSNASKSRSQAWQIDDKLIIIDGHNIYRYSENEGFKENTYKAYIPLITIAKAPNGGGVSYEPLNMLQPGFYEQFTVDSASASAVEFQLSLSGLDATEVSAWILSNTGSWVAQVEDSDFTVDRTTGVVTFINAPGVTPITGEDNVRILAYKTIAGYSDRVKKCKFGTLYGINGAADRLFLSGNPDYQNWDFFSEQYDPTYFPDTGYSALGSSASAIMGYAIVNNYLATFKDDLDNSRAVYIRHGELVEDQATNLSMPAFKLVNTLQGNGVVSPYAFGYLQTEPLFLTKMGIYAITPQDITGEKYSQSRSFYLDGSLEKEEGLENAIALVFKDQYILAINNKFYILDGLQATRTDRSEPYATRQYAGFYCTNIPAFTMWTDDEALWIGTEDGHVCRFETDIDSLDSYNDDGKKIYCCWETPDLDGSLFYKNKNFKYFALRLRAALRTSINLYAKRFGRWEFIADDLLTGIYFDFEHVDFERFSFGTDPTDKVIHTKIRLRRVDKARFRVENDMLNEPLGLLDLALEYTESGNYKEW